MMVNNGETITSVANLTSIPNATTQNCTITATATTISCAMRNAPSQVSSATLTWTRTAATGQWTCATAGASKASLAPKSCPQA